MCLHLARAAQLSPAQQPGQLAIKVPYRPVCQGRLQNEQVVLRPDQEQEVWIGEYCTHLTGEKVLARRMIKMGKETRVELKLVVPQELTYADAIPYGFLSYSSCQVPFIAHNDGARVMMGGKNLKQALPLARPELPLVLTGSEAEAARASKRIFYAPAGGTIQSTSAKEILLKADDGQIYSSPLIIPHPGNKNVKLYQKPRVKTGQAISKDEPLVDAAGIVDGQLEIGRAHV